jgi:hypothetical protein
LLQFRSMHAILQSQARIRTQPEQAFADITS